MTTKTIVTAILMLYLAPEINAQSGKTIQPLIAAYSDLNNALFDSDAKRAKAAAAVIEQALKELNRDSLNSKDAKQITKLEKSVIEIQKTTDIEKQRNYFMTTSESFYQFLKSNSGNSENLYYTFCPMANNGKGAYWISETEKIRNPYYGLKMASCGSVKETLSPVN